MNGPGSTVIGRLIVGSLSKFIEEIIIIPFQSIEYHRIETKTKKQFTIPKFQARLHMLLLPIHLDFHTLDTIVHGNSDAEYHLCMEP